MKVKAANPSRLAEMNMPSPFPGMDPFIESQKWESFHARLLPELANQLVPLLRPKYSVDPEQRVYIETVDLVVRNIIADVGVVRRTDSDAGSIAAVAIEPSVENTSYTYIEPEEHRETYLEIREVATSRLVTVIEVLSPSNKVRGSEGWRQYLAKRRDLLHSRTNLVEIDLLRGGTHLPMVEQLAARDYFVFVRRQSKWRADTLQWNLPSRLPQVPIPLDPPDPDAVIDLQAALDAVYDRAGYDYTLDYKRPIEPPLSETDQKWVSERLAGSQGEPVR
jgi:hypothetical protein